jgi:hypothetical protein
VWGDSILQVVYSAVRNATSVQQHVAGLVPDARNDVISVPGLGRMLDNEIDTAKLTKRFQLARQMRSMFNLVLLEGNGGKGASATGEQWQQRQVSFTQLPELMRSYLGIAAAAADIPVTRLLGESPGGENSTGESDLRNYYDHVNADQRLKIGPSLDILDEVIVRSATGGRDPRIFYVWAPLWTMSELDKANVMEKKATAARALVGAGSGQQPIVGFEAMGAAIVNSLTEDGTLPGLEDAVDQYGSAEELEPPEPPGIIPGAPAIRQLLPPAGRVADAAPRSLYVYRRLRNTADFLDWARRSGFTGVLPASQLHVTVLYSKQQVDWMQMGTSWGSDERGRLVVPPGGPRVVERLGSATVLSFVSSELSWRHSAMVEAGASDEYDSYQAHVTISYEPQTVDLAAIRAFAGPLRFGPEIFEEIDESWRSDS